MCAFHLSTGNGNVTVMDSERKRMSVRANQLEKKKFETMMSNFEAAKRNVVLEMKKSQVDLKRRLKRYKDRQHELNVIRPDTPVEDTEDYLLKQLRIRRCSKSAPMPTELNSHPHPSPSLLSHHPHHTTHNDPHVSGTATTTATYDAATANRSNGIYIQTGHNADLLHSIAQRGRSKADLRPYTAWSAVKGPSSSSSSLSLSSSSTSSSRPPVPSSASHPYPRSFAAGGTPAGLGFLQLRGGSLGTPSRQVRYLNEEEMERRRQVHRFLLGRYRVVERLRQVKISHRVGSFCAKAPLTAHTPSRTAAAAGSGGGGGRGGSGRGGGRGDSGGGGGGGEVGSGRDGGSDGGGGGGSLLGVPPMVQHALRVKVP